GAVGSVVGIRFAKPFIDELSEFRAIRCRNRSRKLNRITVKANRLGLRGIDGADAEVGHRRPDRRSSRCDRTLDLLAYEMLAKGGEAVRSPACNQDPRRGQANEPNGVANDIRPKPGA